MIVLGSRDLPEAVAAALAEWQLHLDGLPTYEQQVQRGVELFRSRNSGSNPVFSVVRRLLDESCQGARRCAYCEDSCADEVEHIRPKTLYPDTVFVWSNYLYACGPCNGRKNNEWAVFSHTGEFLRVSRSRSGPVVPVPAGSAVFLNPRQDNPLDYILLDLQGTFLFSPMAEGNTLDYVRGRYTIDTLRLNRDVLTRGRRGAYGAYLRRLEAYIATGHRGMSQDERDARKREIIVESPHLTVWREMQRQVQKFPAHHSELRDLFMEAPEALHW